MSSTKRGGQRSEADVYPTPAGPVIQLHRELPLPGGKWLECCAGDGAIISATNSVRNDVVWTATELREECRLPLEALVGPQQVVIGDYLSADIPQHDDHEVVITNPPFSLAMEVIYRAWNIPWIVMLLRLNFLGSIKRNEFFRAHCPDVHVIVPRPSYRGKGTDSIEYAWFVWPPRRKRAWGTLTVLKALPKKRSTRDKARKNERRG